MTIKEQFLSMLSECPGYPFDEGNDSLLFDFAFAEYPGIDILQQTGKKIAWWKEHPSALKYKPRNKLADWFKGEYEFQSRGCPKQIGRIMKEIEDPDQRNWISQLKGIEESREPKRSDY